MSEREVITKILSKLDREDHAEAVLESPQTDFENGNLVSLDISDLGLTNLDSDTFDGLDSLRRVHISFNNLTELPEDVFQDLDDLEFINLYGNELVRLPDNIFKGLEKIEWLDLRSNKLEAIPKSVGLLDNINYLFLQNNPLSDHEEHNWAADYHSRRDIRKFMPDFQQEMGLEVTMEKPLTRAERAARAKKRRDEREKAKNDEND